MATKKETVMVKGVELTLHEKKVFDYVSANGVVNYKQVAKDLEISEKSACSSLARLNATKGLLKKNEPIKLTTYELVKED